MLQPLATPHSRLPGNRAAVVQPGNSKIAPTCQQLPCDKLSTPYSFQQQKSRLYTPVCAASTTHHQEWQQQQGPTAAPQLDPRFGALSAWVEARGGSIGSITAGDCQMGPVVVRGLVATQVRTQRAGPMLTHNVVAGAQCCDCSRYIADLTHLHPSQSRCMSQNAEHMRCHSSTCTLAILT